MASDDAKGSSQLEALIDRNLKLVYADLADEAIPDRFKDLLLVLKAQDAAKKAADEGKAQDKS